MSSLQSRDSIAIGLVLDVETTGMSNNDEIIEFAGILFEFHRSTGSVISILDEYRGMREPGCRIHPRAKRVHKIEEHQLEGKQLDCSRIEAMVHRADILLAHNASFDRRFVCSLFPLAGRKEWLCTMNSYPWTAQGFPNRKLDDILRIVGIQRGRSHRAMDDTKALLELMSRQAGGSGSKTYLHTILLSSSLSRRTS